MNAGVVMRALVVAAVLIVIRPARAADIDALITTAMEAPFGRG